MFTEKITIIDLDKYDIPYKTYLKNNNITNLNQIFDLAISYEGDYPDDQMISKFKFIGKSKAGMILTSMMEYKSLMGYHNLTDQEKLNLATYIKDNTNQNHKFNKLLERIDDNIQSNERELMKEIKKVYKIMGDLIERYDKCMSSDELINLSKNNLQDLHEYNLTFDDLVTYYNDLPVITRKKLFPGYTSFKLMDNLFIKLKSYTSTELELKVFNLKEVYNDLFYYMILYYINREKVHDMTDIDIPILSLDITKATKINFLKFGIFTMEDLFTYVKSDESLYTIFLLTNSMDRTRLSEILVTNKDYINKNLYCNMRITYLIKLLKFNNELEVKSNIEDVATLYNKDKDLCLV